MRRLKAFLCAVLCLCSVWAALLCGGCTNDTAVAYAPDAYRGQFAGQWRYGMLDTRLRSCYGALYTAVTETAAADAAVRFQGEIRPGVSVRLPASLRNEAEARLLFETFMEDKPQFFFVSNTFTYGGEPDNYTVFTLLYLMDAPARVTAAAALETAVAAMTAACPTGDAYAAELELHDALAAFCSYDDAAAAAPDTGCPLSFTAYGALVNGTAVCEGYSRALQLLLRRVGIDSTPVRGTSPDTGIPHMWNMVRIDGKTYHTDVTWNDAGKTPHHRYFNLTDEAIALSRGVEDEGLPACTATEANYFFRAGRYIDTFDRAAIAGVIAEAVRSGERSVELCFAPDKYANGALLLSNTPLLVQLVGEKLPDPSVFTDYSLAGVPKEYILTVLL